jgi:Kdo2-lipid IVA lauroyltransferase/acyltransferase
MQAATFYLAFPFIYLLSLMPFSVLYIISDGLYYIIRLSGYRKKVILKNLKNAFPSRSDGEISSLCNQYYRYLCDLLVETLKTLNMPAKETLKRCTFHQQPWLDQLYKEKKSIMIIMGHYGNWEWAGPCFTLSTNYQLVVVYRPLSHPYFEKMMVGMRTRFGTQITPVDKTLRDMVANRDKITATAFIADQTATSKFAYWMKFLNQDTAVFTGPDRLAKKFNYPVVYMKVTRPKRGHYEVTPELLFHEPKNVADNEVIEKFMNRLELDIMENPVPWLWSHMRWKHKKRATEPVAEPVPAI